MDLLRNSNQLWFLNQQKMDVLLCKCHHIIREERAVFVCCIINGSHAFIASFFCFSFLSQRLKKGYFDWKWGNLANWSRQFSFQMKKDFGSNFSRERICTIQAPFGMILQSFCSRWITIIGEHKLLHSRQQSSINPKDFE